MPTIAINGVDLHHEEHGSGDPILCIHGTGSSSALWADAAAALGRRGRTIVYDRRGFSRSGPPTRPAVEVRVHTEDAAALLEALHAGPAIVIGRSQGGEIAMDLALRHPGRVRALVLLEGGGLSLSEEVRRWVADLDDRLYAAGAADVDTVGRVLIETVLGEGGWDALPEPMRRVFTENGAAILAEERGGLLPVDAGRLTGLTHPALVVAARDSPPPFARHAELVAGLLPAAELAWVDGGHLIGPAHPAVLAFVDRVLTGRSGRDTG